MFFFLPIGGDNRMCAFFRFHLQCKIYFFFNFIHLRYKKCIFCPLLRGGKDRITHLMKFIFFISNWETTTTKRRLKVALNKNIDVRTDIVGIGSVSCALRENQHTFFGHSSLEKKKLQNENDLIYCD